MRKKRDLAEFMAERCEAARRRLGSEKRMDDCEAMRCIIETIFDDEPFLFLG